MPNRTQQVRVMDPDVYDTLELVAEAYGGIGGGMYRETVGDERVPLCAWGAANFATDPMEERYTSLLNPVNAELDRLGINEVENDVAVRRVLGADNLFSEGLAAAGRIPFSDWCAALNVVRGE